MSELVVPADAVFTIGVQPLGAVIVPALSTTIWATMRSRCTVAAGGVSTTLVPGAAVDGSVTPRSLTRLAERRTTVVPTMLAVGTVLEAVDVRAATAPD